MDRGFTLFDDLATFLSEFGIEFDGRDFTSMEWASEEKTCQAVFDRAMTIAVTLADSSEREKISESIDYRSLFTLGRACTQIIPDEERGMEAPLAGFALDRYMLNLTKNGEPDVFFEHQCRLRLVRAELCISYRNFRQDIVREEVTKADINRSFMEHVQQSANLITELVQLLQLTGELGEGLNFNDQEQRESVVFDYYIALVEAIRGFMLQFPCAQPVLDIEHATQYIQMAGPLIGNGIECLAPHRETSSTTYILFQTLMAQMGNFFSTYTTEDLPPESLFDQCNRASVNFGDLSPADTYATLFAHYLRLSLVRDHDALASHRATVEAEALKALENSAAVRKHPVYSGLIHQLIASEPVNAIMVSDELSLCL